MSDTVLGWLFGGWFFGRPADEGNAGRDRTRQPSESPDNHEAAARTAETADDHLDDRLAAQVRAGDVVAFEQLFRRYYADLTRFAASYVGGVESGEEAVADVFAWLWEHRATWTPTAAVSAYLFGAVRNRALDVMKRRSREHRRMAVFQARGEAPGLAIPSLTPAERIERDDDVAAVLRLISTLPERRRLILSLRWTHGLAWDEIAAVLGVTSTALHKEHARILASLRAELEAK